MKYLFFILLLFSGVASAQTTYYIQADSTRLRKVGANNELIIENITRSRTGAYLKNILNGRTGWFYAIDSAWMATDSTLVLRRGDGNDTLLIPGGGSGSTPTWQQTLTAGNTASSNLVLDNTTSSSTAVIYKGSNPFLHNFKPSGSTGRNLFLGELAGNFTMTSSGSTSSNIVAIGYQAGNSNTTGFDYVAVGVGALQYNTEGVDNTAVGNYSMNNLTTGTDNTAVGYAALGNGIVTGAANTAVGYDALRNVAAGSQNSGVGESVLNDVTSGTYNTAIGYTAGDGITTGSNNTIIGARITALTSSLANTIILGDGAGNQRLRFNSSGAMSFDGGSTFGTSGYFLTSTGSGSAPAYSNTLPSGTTLPISSLTGALAGNSVNGGGFDFGITNLNNLNFGSDSVTIQNTLFNDNGSRMRISPPTGVLEVYTAGQTTDVIFKSSAGSDNISFDTENQFIKGLTNLGVVGANSVDGSLLLKSTTAVGTTDFINFQVGNNGATEAMRIINSGNVGIGTSTPASLFTVGADQFQVASTGITTIGKASGTTGKINLVGTTSGTVGITTAAAAGTWTLELPANDGDASQVLTTNGSGVTSWTTPSGGSPAGNFGNLQIGRNSAFATPASDSLDWESATGLGITGSVSASVSAITPIITGGSAVGSTLSIQSTTGNGTDATEGIVFQDGSVKFGAILNSGQWGIGTGTTASATYGMTIRQPNDGAANNALRLLANNGTTQMILGYGRITTPGTMVIESQTNDLELQSKVYVGAATTPTAVLHLLAGTATASTAPLKFTSGTNLTTAEAGATEYDGKDLFFTPTGTIRKVIPTIISSRAVAQTAAVGTVATQTVGASDASFIVSANILVTTSSAEAFTTTVAYTDEGNTARTLTLNYSLLAGTIGVNIAFANGAVPYQGLPVQIRCKASTTITIATTGTFTGCTYNVEGTIQKIQ